MKKVLAMNENGAFTYCTVAPEDRGKGRCNHIGHQNNGETIDDFVKRMEEGITDELALTNNELVESYEDVMNSGETELTEEDIQVMLKAIDEIAGEEVTEENIHEILSKLDPESLRKINKIGFDASTEFSLPIADKDYESEDLSNKIYFATLPEYGIAGKATSITQMFDVIGEMPSSEGTVYIDNNYKNGLTPDEYFDKMFSARSASIAKSVSVSAPGYIARKLFYALSDLHVQDDCGNNGDVLNCKIPGGICAKCAANSGYNVEPGTLLGSVISTNLSEPGTQLTMRHFHTGGKDLADKTEDVISNTFDGYRSSPIIQKALLAETTEEARDIVFNELKQEYVNNNIKMDDINVKIIAKKLTSYKRENGVLRYVKDGEKCDIVSIGSIGNFKNPMKSAQLKSQYATLSKPTKFKYVPDAANEIVR